MLLFGIYLFIVIALPLTLSAVVGFRSLPLGHACPACRQETLPLVSTFLRVVNRVIPALSLQRRWCPACEWDGYARMPKTPATVMVPLGVITRRTQQIRTLELGGRVWRVMLESWRDRGRCYGRLLFVAPSGKLWYDRQARHPRKQAIQAMRAAVEGRIEGREVSLAVAGVSTGASTLPKKSASR